MVGLLDASRHALLNVESPDSLHVKQGRNLQPLTPGMFGYSLLRPEANRGFVQQLLTVCQKSDIGIDCFHAETGKDHTGSKG